MKQQTVLLISWDAGCTKPLSDCEEQVEIKVGQARTSPTKGRNVEQTREMGGNRAYLKLSQTDSQVAASQELQVAGS